MIDEIKYNIELSGPGLSLRRELSEEQAHAMLMWLISGQPLWETPSDLKRIAHAEAPRTSASGPPISAREFMHQHEPVRIPDKIACLAMFLRDHRDIKEFTKADIVTIFQEAAEPLPMNLARDLHSTKQMAWIAPVPGRSPMAFYLTHKGEAAVNQKFPKDLRRLVAGKRRKSSITHQEREAPGGAAGLAVHRRPFFEGEDFRCGLLPA